VCSVESIELFLEGFSTLIDFLLAVGILFGVSLDISEEAFERFLVRLSKLDLLRLPSNSSKMGTKLEFIDSLESLLRTEAALTLAVDGLL
jgi:hypothetical protein